MKFLLDTHVLIWSLQDSHRLSSSARAIIGDTNNIIYVSSATIWEIAIKTSLKKLNLSVDEILQTLQHSEYTQLPITFSHAAKVAELPYHHSDPFDRILIAQALTEELTLITCDDKITQYELSLLLIH